MTPPYGKRVGLIRHQMTAVQSALHAILDFSKGTGLQISTEKSSFTVLTSLKAHEQGEARNFPMKYDGVPIQRADDIRVLGIIINQTGSRTIWMDQIKNNRTKVLSLPKRVTIKAWSAQEKTPRTPYAYLLGMKTTMYG